MILKNSIQQTIFRSGMGILLFFVPGILFSQAISVQGGISQPLGLEGYNVAATYYGEKFLIGYSHGGNLRFDANGGLALNDEEKRQNLGVFLPYTTGLSIGYLITKNLDIRIEFKEHYYRVKSDTGLDELALFDSLGLRSDLPLNESTGLWLPGNRNQSFIDNTIEKAILSRLLYNANYVPSNRKARYRTRSFGLGLYYRFFPLGGEEALMLVLIHIFFCIENELFLKILFFIDYNSFSIVID